LRWSASSFDTDDRPIELMTAYFDSRDACCKLEFLKIANGAPQRQVGGGRPSQ
jgi:hypothetical protein